MPSGREGRGGRLVRRVAGAGPLPAAMLEHRALEGAELGHPREADEVAAMGQLAMARRAEQPAMLRPVQAAMEEMVELQSIGCRLALADLYENVELA